MKKSFEHTPGPWVVFVCDGVFTVLPAGRGGEIATKIKNGHDADLIAAAPKMFEAITLMLAHSCVADSAAEDKDPADHEAERLARAAIAQARGGRS